MQSRRRHCVQRTEVVCFPDEESCMNLRRESKLATLLCVLAVLHSAAALAAVTGHPVTPPSYSGTLYPPWSHGENNPALHKGLEFTIPEVDSMPDFHGSINDPKLVIFVGGNYYFAMAPLVKAFEAEHPELRGRIFYVTIPPGLLLKAMEQGNTFTSGNMTFTVAPDVYAAGLKKVKEQIATGRLVEPAVPYATNDLTIMVPKGNPGHITGLADLGKPGVRLVMPNPAWEGVARQIKASLRKAGGAALEQMVYDTKVQDGHTILTHIHHRQTPLFLMQGLGVAGVTWKSEAIFQEQSGHPIGHVDIPAIYNTTAVYGAALVKGAPHPEAGKLWLEFLGSPTALEIFERFGFKQVPADAGKR
jgi:ABC-type molybdate transport system substrate-binding protein